MIQLSKYFVHQIEIVASELANNPSSFNSYNTYLWTHLENYLRINNSAILRTYIFWLVGTRSIDAENIKIWRKKIKIDTYRMLRFNPVDYYWGPLALHCTDAIVVSYLKFVSHENGRKQFVCWLSEPDNSSPGVFQSSGEKIPQHCNLKQIKFYKYKQQLI